MYREDSISTEFTDVICLTMCNVLTFLLRDLILYMFYRCNHVMHGVDTEVCTALLQNQKTINQCKRITGNSCHGGVYTSYCYISVH